MVSDKLSILAERAIQHHSVIFPSIMVPVPFKAQTRMKQNAHFLLSPTCWRAEEVTCACLSCVKARRIASSLYFKSPIQKAIASWSSRWFHRI